MNIIIGAKKIDLTKPLETYINQKFAPIAKFVKAFDAAGEAELRVEVSRTTQHHKKGEVFAAAADLRIPKRVIRAEESGPDIRTAIDRTRDTLKNEIEKHKTKLIAPRRGKTPR